MEHKATLSGECISNGDGSCTLNIRAAEGQECDCAQISITVKCQDECCGASGCC